MGVDIECKSCDFTFYASYILWGKLKRAIAQALGFVYDPFDRIFPDEQKVRRKSPGLYLLLIPNDVKGKWDPEACRDIVEALTEAIPLMEKIEIEEDKKEKEEAERNKEENERKERERQARSGYFKSGFKDELSDPHRYSKLISELSLVFRHCAEEKHKAKLS